MKIVVSDNKDEVKQIREELRRNDGYCPCKPVKNDDTKCMCKEFLEQKSGKCYCGLYIKVE